MSATENKDKMIMALRDMYQEEQDGFLRDRVRIGSEYMSLHRESLPGREYSMLFPENMEDMPQHRQFLKYRNGSIPSFIRTDSEGDATFTFDFLPRDIEGEYGEAEGGGEDILLQIRRDMEKIWDRNVFYDAGEVRGEEIRVAWMDQRAFCLDGSLYSMLFLFETGRGMMLGNFHCSFPICHKWKPVVPKLLATIRADGEDGEGDRDE